MTEAADIIQLTMPLTPWEATRHESEILQVGARVRLGGRRVGRVVKVRRCIDPPALSVEVKLENGVVAELFSDPVHAFSLAGR